MKSQIIGLTDWLKTPPGVYLLDWERAHFDQAVSDIFGYHALQLGLPEFDALQANRIPHQWLALTHAQPSLLQETQSQPISSRAPALATDPAALPFPENSLDLVVLPHTLELGADPHSALREVARVLVPEGRVVISGFNPVSLWGLRQERDYLYRRFGYADLFLPGTGDFIGYWRLRDWLRLLNFEVESARFGCYRPALSSQKWLDRFEWMDTAGERWWPIFGAVYFLVAVKRVRGMRLLEPGWKHRKAPAAAPAAVASKKPLNL
ncbi:MAG: class I SAM-dependent methyltransferase [Pseudomonadota bacterium]|nr:class I SAM-dependent methyltransferase [Pseudomonadota bacterium]